MERLHMRPTLGQVLEQLDAEAHAGPLDRQERERRAREALEAQRAGGKAGEAPLPWYVRLLMGAGAWVSTLFLLGALSAFGILQSGAASVALGLLCAGGALALRRGSSSDFLVQLSLSLSMCGRAMIYGGVAGHSGASSPTLAAVVALAVELATVAVFPDSVNRFVSTMGAWSSLLVLLSLRDAPMVAYDVAGGALAAAVALLWIKQPEILRGPFAEHHAPVAFGLSFALLLMLLGSWWMPSGTHPVWVRTALITATALWAGASILRELRVSEPGPRATVAAVTLALGLVTLGSPGVPAALLLMALGFHRRNPLLLGAAAAFLAVFGVKFYYDLALTLLVKSGALLGSGLLLLGARALVERRRTP